MPNRYEETGIKRSNRKTGTDEARALNAYVKLMRASESLTARVHRHMIDAGLTVTQFGVMETLYSLGPSSQREIGCKILKAAGTLRW